MKTSAENSKNNNKENSIPARKPLVEIKELYKTYIMGEVKVRAVRNINVTINREDFVAVMGQSGSGKSTLMNILGCLDKPTSGKYLLDNVDISKLNRDELAQIRNEKIGFVFQGFNLLARTNALENVELPMLYSGKYDSFDRQKRASEALESVGLGRRMHHFPSQMSGGEQQRVAIARSLVNNPALILADEPTGNLDTRTSVEIMNIFQKLNEEKNITIIMVTHEEDIARYAKRILAMRDGRIIEDRQVENRLSAQELISSGVFEESDYINNH